MESRESINAPQAQFESAVLQLKLIFDEKPNLSLKTKKEMALPIIQKYIFEAKSLRELHETYQYLTWDKSFIFLKERRHPLFDALFGNNQLATWSKILKLINLKIANLILCGELDLNDVEEQVLYNNLSSKVTFDPKKANTILLSCEFILAKVQTAIAADQYFVEAAVNYKNHYLSKGYYLFALQNVHLLVYEKPTADPLLDTLRYLLLIVLNQNVTELKKAPDSHVSRNIYKQIRTCIHESKTQDELTRIISYLYTQPFDFITKKDMEYIMAKAKEHLHTLDPNSSFDDCFKQSKNDFTKKSETKLLNH